MAVTIDGTKGVTSSGSFYGQTTFTGTYTDGVVVDYTTGMGRISVGTSDGLTIYNGGVASSALVTVDSSGNVGIGTSSPSTYGQLAVYRNTTDGTNANIAAVNAGTTASYAGFEAKAGTVDWQVFSDAAGNAIGTAGAMLRTISNHPMVFGTNTTEKMRLSAAGGLSIGTTADPGAGAIYATGNITAYYSSDIKFKENVRAIPNAVETVNAIGGKLFDWTDDYIKDHGGADGYFVQKQDFGVVAQDVQKVFPVAVRTRPDGSLAVDYEKLSALAFAALVELTKRIEVLEAK